MLVKASFPRDFLFGFSTVGVQHEMGLSGSEFESDWTLWLKDEENIIAGIVSGDRPEDGPGYWYLFREDHERALSIGMNAAWITIEWARIFPRPTYSVYVQVEKDREGVKRVVVEEKHIEKLDELANKSALEHYIEILRDWKNRGGYLIVNLFHWSMPTWLHNPLLVRKKGVENTSSGWVDERSVVEFAKFAAYIAYKLGDLPDAWYTMNEPSVISILGYVFINSGFPPGYLDLRAYNLVVKHLAEAHARAYDVIRQYSSKPIGLVDSIAAWTPLRDRDEDVAEKGFMDNIWAFEAAAKGVLHGVKREDLGNRLDWIGLNYYTRNMVVEDPRSPRGYRVLDGYGYNCSVRGLSKDNRYCTDMGWEIYPEGIYDVSVKLYRRYRKPIYITENGIADSEDRLRSWFIISHLYRVYKAIREGVDIRGYFYWNLIDNLEWTQGFRKRFGLFMVDYTTKKRYPRPSAYVFREIAINKEIPGELLYLANPPMPGILD